VKGEKREMNAPLAETSKDSPRQRVFYLHEIEAHCNESHSEQEVDGTEDESQLFHADVLCICVEFELLVG
jgi:hypothetical protein